MKFSINYFSSKCEQIRSFLRICSHLPEKYLMENFIFCAVQIPLWHPSPTFDLSVSLRYGSRYSKIDQFKFVEDSLLKNLSDMVCLSRPCHFKFFKRLSSTNFTRSILEYLDPYNQFESELHQINMFSDNFLFLNKELQRASSRLSVNSIDAHHNIPFTKTIPNIYAFIASSNDTNTYLLKSTHEKKIIIFYSYKWS